MDDTANGTMTLARMKRLRKDHERLSRQGGVRYKELTGLAQRLGRRRRKSRGGDQAWVSTVFPDLRATTIPEHRGDMNPYVAKGILKALEEDLERWEDRPAGSEKQEVDSENAFDA